MTSDKKTKQFNQGLCHFLDESPSPFHAVANMKFMLEEQGFKQLNERESWSALAAGSYYVTRNDSSLIAFRLPDKDIADTGYRMVGAHTDSPCLKVKPQPEVVKQNLLQLGVEVYGGVLLNPWFDRDLSMAGRVSFFNDKGQLCSALLNFERPVLALPSLAIHLDREANNNKSINPQKDLPPILMQLQDGETKPCFREMLKQQLLTEKPELDSCEIVDYEIYLYDCQKAAVVGLKDQFISSARLDNLLSCYVGLSSLIASDREKANLLICTDHEEVGSVSAAGAQGSFMESVLLRLAGDNERYQRMLANSMLISADNAHAIHPNFADKHDSEHGPQLNRGPVIKTNANQRYATASESSAIFRRLCQVYSVPVQDFVARTDLGCGSTIGPVIASNLGIKTIDVGVPTYAMHSIREMAGSEDADMLNTVLTGFYNCLV